MKILVLANHYNTLRIFRRELLKALSEAGHEVVVSIPPATRRIRRFWSLMEPECFSHPLTDEEQIPSVI